MHFEVLGAITYPFPNFHTAILEFQEWIIGFILKNVKFYKLGK